MGIETSGEEADQLFATVDTNKFVINFIMVKMVMMVVIRAAEIVPSCHPGWENME